MMQVINHFRSEGERRTAQQNLEEKVGRMLNVTKLTPSGEDLLGVDGTITVATPIPAGLIGIPVLHTHTPSAYAIKNESYEAAETKVKELGANAAVIKYADSYEGAGICMVQLYKL